jgi:hypothetical protein
MSKYKHGVSSIHRKSILRDAFRDRIIDTWYYYHDLSASEKLSIIESVVGDLFGDEDN